MRNLMLKLWNDDRGALIATEWVFVATILVIGLVVGLKAVQQAVVTELEDVAGAVGSLSQAYQFGGTSGCGGSTNGSQFGDAVHAPHINTNTDSTNSNDNATCPD